MGDLVERLRSADMNSQQRVLGSRIFGEAADEITRLRAALADAQAVGFAAGVEAAKTAVSLNAWKHGGDDAYSVGMDVGARQQNEQDLAAIRALTPPEATAAAARVLLGVWPTDASFRAAFDACAARYHGGDQMQDVMDRTRETVSAALRAIAGDTP